MLGFALLKLGSLARILSVPSVLCSLFESPGDGALFAVIGSRPFGTQAKPSTGSLQGRRGAREAFPVRGESRNDRQPDY